MSDVLIAAVGVLDSLPNAGRALLSGALLAAALVFLESRLPRDCSGLAIAYRKTALVALIAVPLVTGWALDFRFVVLVEELPVVGQSPALATWVLLLAWAAGVVVHGLKERPRSRLSRSDGASPDTPVLERAEFWRQRIGVSRPVTVRLSSTENPAISGLLRPVLYLPRSIGRWPAGVQDAILAHGFLLVRHHDWAWLALSRAVAALYWPTPPIGRLTADLRRAFLGAADARALEYLKDRLGYARALNHVAQRIAPLPNEPSDGATPLLSWQDARALQQRSADLDAKASADPCYERVFWAMAQATLVVFLLTGSTLERFYADEPAAWIPDALWYVSFVPSGRYEEVKDWSSMPPTARNPRLARPARPPGLPGTRGDTSE